MDSIPTASNGFAAADGRELLRVELPAELSEMVPEEKREALLEVLAQDPRPQYQHSPERVYTMSFAGMEVSFRVDNNLLTVIDIVNDSAAT